MRAPVRESFLQPSAGRVLPRSGHRHGADVAALHRVVVEEEHRGTHDFVFKTEGERSGGGERGTEKTVVSMRLFHIVTKRDKRKRVREAPHN